MSTASDRIRTPEGWRDLALAQRKRIRELMELLRSRLLAKEMMKSQGSGVMFAVATMQGRPIITMAFGQITLQLTLEDAETIADALINIVRTAEELTPDT